ncbi:MAG: hypothetical protein AB7F98_04615 [Novosphingobium sp.]
MTMHFRALADQAMADGAISAEELLSLRGEGWQDGVVDRDEADALFVINRHLGNSSVEWTDFFVEAAIEFVFANSSPRGYVDEDGADWLIEQIEADGRLETMAELELLERLFERAENVPASLQAFATAQIEKAVLEDSGPTRSGGSLEPGMIGDTESRLLRRFIFAPASERPAAVGRGEAELLFRIKDATRGADNSPAWKQLFVQGVGNYLQGFGGHEPLSAERAAELETFMNSTATGIGSFFTRLTRSNLATTARGMFKEESGYLEFGEQAAADAELTGSEKDWLQAQMDADGELDELEQALLDFLAEE